MSAKFDFSTKEGKNAYQRYYWNANPEKYQKMLKQNRKNRRNKRNINNCSCKENCEVKEREGINFRDCICRKKCEYYAGERELIC